MITKWQSEDGNIKLINGDFNNIIDNIKDESIDLILTDIPFNISKDNNFKTMKDREGRNGIDFEDWDKNFDESVLYKLQSKIKKGGSLVLFHSFEQFSLIMNIFDNLEFKDKIIWQKSNPMPRNRDRRYISNVEIASWYVKKGEKWIFNRQSEKYDGCVFLYPSESGGGFKRFHPTQKNLQLIKDLILRHSNEGDLVADFFFGSCQVGVACKQLNRKFIGSEIDEKYFDIAVERIKGE